MMAGAAHDPKFAKKVGVPQKVAKEFNRADKGTSNLRLGAADKPMPRDRPMPRDMPMPGDKMGPPRR
jgi:hypothetical protein